MMNSQLFSQEKLPSKRLLADLKIGYKLNIGFGMLVALIFFSAIVSYFSSSQKVAQIQYIGRLRSPVAVSAARTQSDLLRMLSDVRGYLALGDTAYRDSYQRSAVAFESDLIKLEKYSVSLGVDDKERLAELRTTYEKWRPLPEVLFDLRDNQIRREPAYRMLATDGVEYAGGVIISLNQMLVRQSQQEPTIENMAILVDMANFQGNFLAMLSALRGSVTTRNSVYRYEYEANLGDNNRAWERLLQEQGSLTPSQRQFMDDIDGERQAFVALSNDLFKTLESNRWRTDLYRFQNEAVPLADKMDKSLNDLVINQQRLLDEELASSSRSPFEMYLTIWGSSLVSLLIGVTLAFASYRAIATPISRLTNVAQKIRGGDMEARATVESRDEIGVLAATFNSMTYKLSKTLSQVRKEKGRADNLLKVVIPMGVELTYQRDLQKLLEDVLREAKLFCHADGGTLYLKKENALEFVVMHNDSLKINAGGTSGKAITIPPLHLQDEGGKPNHHNLATHVALTGRTVNVKDAYKDKEFDFSGARDFDKQNNYKSVSFLTIPLKNSKGEVLGVLQLINAHEPETTNIIPFDENLQEMMESFSSLAIAALESYAREQALRQEIHELHIVIDQTKRQKQVDEIIESDFFQDLSSRAKSMRNRGKPAQNSGT